MPTNIVVVIIFVISSIPTIVGVWANNKLEHSLPWYLWTIAFMLTSVNVFRRADRTKPEWRLLMVMPIQGVIIHITIALLATR